MRIIYKGKIIKHETLLEMNICFDSQKNSTISCDLSYKVKIMHPERSSDTLFILLKKWVLNGKTLLKEG